ncbi:MAG: glycosyltransferase family 2 protein [Acidobacteriia bacterium]|nr:glycosyltransferase family 2 protein [Terriglobia bacterium]
MISIVVPAYNGAEFLDSALASIEAQQFADREVLLVDDGSEDELRPPAFVRYFRQPHQGASAAYNRGIRESRGEFLAFHDIDDLWTPGHLSRLHAALLAHPEAGIAQGRMRQLSGDRISGPYRMPYIQSCLFRREVFEISGGLDETMPLGEDYDLMYRCWEKDIVKINVEEVSLVYRRHDGNISRGNNFRSHLMVMKRRVDRIRSGQVDPTEQRRFLFRDYIGDPEGAIQWTLWSAS